MIEADSRGQSSKGAAWARLGAIFLAAALCARLHAAQYRAPVGFNDHSWGQPFSAFQGLKLTNAQEALNSPGKVTDPAVSCTARFRTISPTQPPELFYTCDSNPQGEGDGSFAVAEYYLQKDRNPWFAQQVAVEAISYLFCASWQGDYAPKDMKSRLKLCGARITFQSDTKKQLAKHDGDYRSNFDRLLRQLIADYGEPPGYELIGRVTIESGTEHLTAPEKAVPDEYRYRWCGLDEAAPQLRPNCAATVTLVFDTTSGEGTLLYATAPMYAYAYGRHQLGQESDELYVLLNGRPADKKQRYVRARCTGSLICNRGGISPMSSKELRLFQP
ncbi:MAG TPA: hypothetical protein VGM84_04730 [Steroidobacteraceae bacterium]|jgi:hypothetical protein